MKHIRIGLSVLSILLAVALVEITSVHAATGVPNVLNYQGALQDDAGNPVTAEKTMSFRIYPAMDTPKASALWVSGDMTLQVSQGRFSINLGDTTGIPPKIPAQPAFPADLFKDDTRYLGISVDGSELLERKKLVSVPYALSAGSGGIPKGIIAMWSGTVVPEGWALCDGQNGTPDLRDRFIIGAVNINSIGNTGGEASHTLTEAEMPSHTHIQDPHKHGIQSRGSSGSALLLRGSDDSEIRYTDLATATNQNTGGGAAHNNLPPYFALCFIIKL